MDKMIMNKQWIPQRIFSPMNFLWWELDEIIWAAGGIGFSAVSGNWLWALLGISITYLYMKYYKTSSSLRITWKDFFIASGLFDLRGYPKGVVKKMIS